MIKLINPFEHIEGYNCYGCCNTNKDGFNLKFFDDNHEIVSFWSPKHQYEGWINVIHGGIQSALLDELASWVVFTQCDSIGVTSKLNVTYIKSVFATNKELEIRGKLISYNEKTRIAEIWVGLYNDDKVLCTEADVYYFIFPKSIAQRKFKYKGKESFYPLK